MKFIQGETRLIGIEVISQTNDVFSINSAQCTVLKQVAVGQDLEFVSDLVASVSDHKITTVFPCTERGTFYAEFSYSIASETIKSRVLVEVI